MSQRMYGTPRSGWGTIVAIVVIVMAIAAIGYFAWWVPLRHGVLLISG